MPNASLEDLPLLDERSEGDKARIVMRDGFVLGDTDFSPTPPEFIRSRLSKLPRIAQTRPNLILRRFQVVAVGDAPDLHQPSQGVMGTAAGAVGAVVGGAVGGVATALLGGSIDDPDPKGLRGSSVYVACDILLVVGDFPFRTKVNGSGPRAHSSEAIAGTIDKALSQLADMISAQHQ